MKQTYKKIAVIGGGVMGTVLARALFETSASKNVLVCEKNAIRYKELEKISSRVETTGNSADCGDAEIIFLAIKPQDFQNLEIKIKKETLICSIMAGVSISEISNQLKTKKIARMMPNIASRVNEGFTAWTATKGVNTKEKKWLENFLTQIGDQLYVKTEDKINKATAVTGSGPAYIFNTLSFFTEATQKLGFTEKESRLMVRQVLRGASALVNKDVDFAELTRQVTSKGGTTEAALKVFAESDQKQTWSKAINAAYKRTRELSKKK